MSLAPTCTRLAVFVILVISTNLSSIFAQQVIEGTPVSSEEKYQQLLFSSDIPIETISSLDLEKIKREDQSQPGTNRYAAPIETSLTMENSGQWTDLPDGGRVWRLKIEAKKALGVCFLYKNFFMPNGARLYMYNENKTHVLGAYSSINNYPHRKFMTGMIEEEAAIIEYFEPKYARGKGSFEIYQVMQAYHPERMKSDYEFQSYSGFGESLDCEKNINCSLGNGLQDLKRGVVRIRTVYTSALGWCTGSLINNTKNDGTPYILTANHCGNPTGFTPDYTQWRFDFNFEFSECGNETNEPVFQSISSCQLISNREESDFLLVSLYSFIPTDYNAYFNGWDRSETIPTSASMIHHPAGDVKKMSLDNDNLIIHPIAINWDDFNIVVTPPEHHFRSVLDYGTMEPGSSGCPLFNQDNRIVGQLHGGNADCETKLTYHGRFSKSWDEGSTAISRLSNWLDPLQTGAMTLDGMEAPIPPVTADISGMIIKENGVELTGVDLNVTGDANITVNNNTDGTYQIADLNIGQSFTVAPSKGGLVNNGVTTFDMVIIQQAVLGQNSLSPYKLIAADVNNSGTVTTFDMVLLRRVILQIDTEFELVPSWRFIPADFEFFDPANPFPDPNNPLSGWPEIDPFSPLLTNMNDRDYIAIKMGDLNDSAN